MKCEPNEETYRLLLDCVCEKGDIEQAIKIVTLMKEKQIPADERLFNALILGHAIKGGLVEAEKVMNTMNTAHVPITSATYNAIIRGLALQNDHKEFIIALQKFPDVVKENELLKLLLIIGSKGNHSWLNDVMRLVGPIKLSKQASHQLDLFCIHFVHLGQPEAAMECYKMFAEPVTASIEEGTYAFFLLTEMLRGGISTKTIINIIKDLKERNLNMVAIEKLTGVALKKGYTAQAWELLKNMSNLRPHYFWPLFLQAHRRDGETGVINTLKTMLDWGVKPDTDTLEYYCIALCDLTDPKLLLMRLQNLGFTTRELVTPLLCFLLRENKLKAAANLCKVYGVVILSERLLQPLVNSWCRSGDCENVIQILQKMNTSSVIPADYTGQFLLRAFKESKTPADYERFLKMLKIMKTKELEISTTVSDSLTYWLRSPNYKSPMNDDIETAVDNLINPALNHFHTHIIHPRDMHVTELENHLIELQNKNMDRRGALRRLIQEHSRLGNEKRVSELREQFISAGYDESPGMKAALMHTYIINNNIDNALSMYNEIKTAHPSFMLDDFKIVNLAHMLVTKKQFDLAVQILKTETENRKIQGGPNLIRNCWRLLGAVGDEARTEQLFHLLVERGYCVPSNIILGPLVKVHLNKGNLSEAVETYKNCAEKYNCTPLQLELLCALVAGENEHLIQEALNITSKIHGAEAASMSLIAALAQSGLHKSLRKFLIEAKDISKREIAKRCERWVKENNVFALETLAHAAYRLPFDIIDRNMVYHAIMKIHSMQNDCEAAVEFYRQLIEKEDNIPKMIVDELLRLVHRCKYEMPELLTKQNS